MVESRETQALVSALLDADSAAGSDSLDRLFPLVYQELRRLARRQLFSERVRTSLNTTGLVHEAYLRLAADSGVSSRGRAYFFAAAATAMRHVLVDAARRRGRIKRGGDRMHITLDEETVAVDGFSADVLALDEALTRLSEHYPRQARVVECRHFAGLSVEETATALDTSARSVVRDWTLARAWLFRELETRAQP